MGIRFGQENDEKEINRLFQLVFGKQRSLNHWYWKYTRHPHNELPFILVYERNNHIVGHVALWVSSCYISGVEKKVGLRIDTMVDPQSRNQGIYQKLNEELLKIARQGGVEILYGFPAPKAKQKLLQRTQAANAGEISRYVLLLNPVKAASSKIKGLKLLNITGELYKRMRLRGRRKDWPSAWKIEPVSQCDDRFTELAVKTNKLKRIMIKRDKFYLNWRYHQHPDNTYNMLAISFENSLCGYIVTKQETKKAGSTFINVGTIVDWLSIEDEQARKYVIEAGISQLQNSDVIQTWMTPGNGADLLKQSGFIEKDKPASLIIHSLLDKDYTLDDWWLTLGDVDSY